MPETSAPAITELATGLQFPEGPVVMPDGSIVITEIKSGTLARVQPDGAGAVERFADLGGGPNGAALGPDGFLYVANNGGFLWSEFNGITIPVDMETRSNEPPGFTGGWIDRVNPETGERTVLYRECDGWELRGPNDLVFDHDGGFWFTDFGKSQPRSTDKGFLHYARADGSFIERVPFAMYGPNGVGLSPDESRLYVAESMTGRLLGWDLTAPGRVAAPQPEVIDATKSHFDSLAVEESGKVVVAAIGHGLCVLEPDGSGHEYMEMPDPMTTNVAFGGPDRMTAYVTLSGYGRLVSLAWPRPGLPLVA
jgi:gluconolactonase